MCDLHGRDTARHHRPRHAAGAGATGVAIGSHYAAGGQSGRCSASECKCTGQLITASIYKDTADIAGD